MPDAGSLDKATRTSASEVERELSRVLPKESFTRMQILGQFNLGFIIARSSRRRRACGAGEGEGGGGGGEEEGGGGGADGGVEGGGMGGGGMEGEDESLLNDGDLFIIDQHAADEKFRFETLQVTAASAPPSLLLSPRP